MDFGAFLIAYKALLTAYATLLTFVIEYRALFILYMALCNRPMVKASKTKLLNMYICVYIFECIRIYIY